MFERVQFENVKRPLISGASKESAFALNFSIGSRDASIVACRLDLFPFNFQSIRMYIQGHSRGSLILKGDG